MDAITLPYIYAIGCLYWMGCNMAPHKSAKQFVNNSWLLYLKVAHTAGFRDYQSQCLSWCWVGIYVGRSLSFSANDTNTF